MHVGGHQLPPGGLWRRPMVVPVVVALLAAPSILALRGSLSSHPVLYGLNVPDNNQTTVANLARKGGYRPQVLSVFVKIDSPSFSPATLARVGKMGADPIITLEPWGWKSRWGSTDMRAYSLAQLASGRWDGKFKAVAKVIRGYGRPVYLRFAQEMNGWWYPWAQSVNGNRPGDFVHAWRHVRGVFRAVGATNVQWIWAPNALTFSSKGTSNLRSLYPGDRDVDLIGLTGYGHGSSASQTFDPTLKALRAVSHKRIIICETAADGANKTRWITSVGAYHRGHQEIDGFVWFNTSPSSGATGDYRFDDTPQHTTAFRSLLRTARVSDRSALASSQS
jgi:hypothetical protein